MDDPVAGIGFSHDAAEQVAQGDITAGIDLVLISREEYTRLHGAAAMRSLELGHYKLVHDADAATINDLSRQLAVLHRERDWMARFWRIAAWHFPGAVLTPRHRTKPFQVRCGCGYVTDAHRGNDYAVREWVTHVRALAEQGIDYEYGTDALAERQSSHRSRVVEARFARHQVMP